MASKAATVIAAGTVVAGRIEGAEDVDLFGRIQGSLTLKGALKIDEKARVDAEVQVTRLEVRGILVGNATATDSIELFGSARVVGDLVAPRIVVREGARFRGLIDMGDPEDEDESAPPARPAPRRPAAPSRPAPRPAATTRPAARPRPAPADAEDDADAEEP
ncbi:MAG: polymer-forming cytoskeletal protein [bacterium]